MQYITIRNNDTAVLSFGGRFTFSRCKAVKADFTTAFQNGCTKVVIDFQNTQSIDSAAVRLLCDICNQVHEENFSVQNARDDVRNMLRSSGLDSWLVKH